MTKLKCISYMKPVMKEKGYRKTRGYWHRETGKLISCVFVESSQWDKDDYYIEVGWALPDPERKAPTQLEWCARGRIGETNPEPEKLLAFLNGQAAQVDSIPALMAYLGKTHSIGGARQIWFMPYL